MCACDASFRTELVSIPLQCSWVEWFLFTLPAGSWSPSPNIRSICAAPRQALLCVPHCSVTLCLLPRLAVTRHLNSWLHGFTSLLQILLTPVYLTVPNRFDLSPSPIEKKFISPPGKVKSLFPSSPLSRFLSHRFFQPFQHLSLLLLSK